MVYIKNKKQYHKELSVTLNLNEVSCFTEKPQRVFCVFFPYIYHPYGMPLQHRITICFIFADCCWSYQCWETPKSPGNHDKFHKYILIFLVNVILPSQLHNVTCLFHGSISPHIEPASCFHYSSPKIRESRYMNQNWFRWFLMKCNFITL